MNILTPEAQRVINKERFGRYLSAKDWGNPMIHLEMLALASKLKNQGVIKTKK